MIYFYYKFFDWDKEANVDAIKLRWLRSQILSFLYFSNFIFKENLVFNEKDNPSQKVVITEEELDGIDRDDIGNFEDLPRLVVFLFTRGL